MAEHHAPTVTDGVVTNGAGAGKSPPGSAVPPHAAMQEDAPGREAPLPPQAVPGATDGGPPTAPDATAQAPPTEPGASAQAPETAAVDDRLHLVVKDQHDLQMTFYVRRMTPLGKLKSVFAEKVGKNVKDLRFLYDGVRIMDDQTAEMLDMEEEDVIEVHTEQIGG
ncbi:SUMO protein smt3 [Elasticomyces elasticus]|nr:hypothetical protein LTR28_003668 [Elasticomyces elasticus]KAK5000966.1 SUMO protein smt3 [Elasticomyces elasticus]